MAFEGSCHCGAITFRVDDQPPTTAISCNCSHCRRKGLLLSFVPAEALTITQGTESLAAYFFNKHVIAHRFCATCGCQPFGSGTAPGGSAMAAINLRCVPTIDLDSLTIEKVDGAKF